MARFIAKADVIRKQIRELEKHFDEVVYSYKTNPEIGNWILDNEEIRVSVSSWKMLEHVEPGRAVYFVQGEGRETLRKIREMGVEQAVVDNFPDLEAAVEAGFPEIFIRLKAKQQDIFTGRHFAYGFSAEEAEVAARMLKEHGITLSIHFHRKTQNVGEWYAEIPEPLLEEARSLNIGGGIPWVYHNSKPDIEEIFRRIDEMADRIRERGVKFAAEPGRYIAAPAVDLEARVMNIYGRVAILDCSIYNAYIDTFLHGIRLEIEGEGQGREYLLKGCTPDSLDVFRYSVMLPELKVGDVITFKSAGAYNFHCDFNFLPKIPYEWR